MKPLSQVFLSSLLILMSHLALAQPLVKYSGKMSKIHKEGVLDAAILVDSIVAKHLYALGPVENLRGEIIVWDGKPFVAAITEEKKPYLRKNVKDLKAIFLVYVDVQQWDTIILKQNISSLAELERVITNAAFKNGTDTTSAFPFLLIGKVEAGSGHIMFKDSLVTNINSEAIKAAKHINSFTRQDAQMLGFYSQHHQSIFTHHDSFLHIHYRLRNKYQAGHLDAVSFVETEPIKLILPHQ